MQPDLICECKACVCVCVSVCFKSTDTTANRLTMMIFGGEFQLHRSNRYAFVCDSLPLSLSLVCSYALFLFCSLCDRLSP